MSRTVVHPPLGSGVTEEPKKKPIEFKKELEGKPLNFREPWTHPEGWKNIILLRLNYKDTGLDLMYAWDDAKCSSVVLGHYNDGVVS